MHEPHWTKWHKVWVNIPGYSISELMAACMSRHGQPGETNGYNWSAHINSDGHMEGIDFYFKDPELATLFKLTMAYENIQD